MLGRLINSSNHMDQQTEKTVNALKGEYGSVASSEPCLPLIMPLTLD